jgi:hypothetical protein
MDTEYENFVKTCKMIPKRIYNKLSKMPNNKGYIWKGVYLFGFLPPEAKKPVVLFERVERDIIHIHEYTLTNYKVYKKSGDNRKTLLFKRKKKRVEYERLNTYISSLKI